jgi:hypothetical protein
MMGRGGVSSFHTASFKEYRPDAHIGADFYRPGKQGGTDDSLSGHKKYHKFCPETQGSS